MSDELENEVSRYGKVMVAAAVLRAKNLLEIRNKAQLEQFYDDDESIPDLVREIVSSYVNDEIDKQTAKEKLDELCK